MNQIPRLILLTNDTTILALSDFPFYVVYWNVFSTKKGDLIKRDDRIDWCMETSLRQEVKSIRENTEKPIFLKIEDRLNAMQIRLKPKIGSLYCVDAIDGDAMLWKRVKINTKNVSEIGFQSEILDKMDAVWDKSRKYCLDINENTPEHRRPSILILEKINNDEDQARSLPNLWEIYDKIIQSGNELAKTPICLPFYQIETKKNVYEYIPINK